MGAFQPVYVYTCIRALREHLEKVAAYENVHTSEGAYAIPIALRHL